jgi:hypothetical protein
MLCDNDFIVLNAVYLKKMADAASIAEITALPSETVAASLDAAAQAGWLFVMPNSAMPTGAMLMPDGTAQVLDYYANAYSAMRADPAMLAWYEGFEIINTRFIGLVTEWQKTEGDERVERRLLQTAERLTRDITTLVPRITRYAAYVRRFERSMDLVDQGQRDFVCKPTLDSVHNIWFEFHEDILAVLGRPRDTT